MNPIRIRRHEISLRPQSARVIVRPFIPIEKHLVTAIIARALELSEEEVTCELDQVRREFHSRHFDIEAVLMARFTKVEWHVDAADSLSRDRRLLIGALFSGEYALESAALFNPSIVPHPDQSDAPPGGLRFIMSLRATGEGHISSIEFRSGTITGEGNIVLDHVSRFVTEPEIIPDPRYDKGNFLKKLREMGVADSYLETIMAPLAERFTRSDLRKNMATAHAQAATVTHELTHTLDSIRWLANSNYELRFAPQLGMSERIIFPVSANESNGIEDARFVRFVDDDGSVVFYATYTAYNGHDILPQLIRTEDFLDFRVLTLNGHAVQNKGMALFPRRIGGRYAMLSRQDNENLFIMFSGDPYHWSDPRIILRPAAMWEAVKVGNCGSPIETEAGWLVITHGVGPMRKYCIGAALLDLEDPTRVISRLRTPLLCPGDGEREGYVPNVVYSCGALLHGRELILPFAISDQLTTIASVSLDDLLAALRPGAESVPCAVAR